MGTYNFCRISILLSCLYIFVTFGFGGNCHANAQERLFGIVPSTDPLQNIGLVAAGAALVGKGVLVGKFVSDHFNNQGMYLFEIRQC